MKRHAPAAARNQDPLLGVLRPLLWDGARLLEIASGTGQHAAYFAACLPGVIVQPSELDAAALASIAAYRDEAALHNLLPPIRLDAASPAWPAADAVLCVNMIHVAPWTACEGLFAGAGRTLAAGGVLLLYGPFRFSGMFTAESNDAFDQSLRAHDPAWGVRDVEDLRRLGDAAGLDHEATVALPANNHVLVFRKQ